MLVAALLGCSAAVFAADGRAAGDTAPELAQALQRQYDTVKDFSADFVHAYQGGVLRKQISERGRVLIKKPGKMRWDYTAPEPKLFVSDGTKIYSYIPQDKQVIVTSVPRDDEATMPAPLVSVGVSYPLAGGWSFGGVAFTSPVCGGQNLQLRTS